MVKIWRLMEKKTGYQIYLYLRTSTPEMIFLQALRRPQGTHSLEASTLWVGRRMSHAPGLDSVTWFEPGEGTKGVIIDATAIGDPERSWIITVHPFRCSL